MSLRETRLEKKESLCLRVSAFLHFLPRIMTQVFACFTFNAIKVYPSLLSFEGTADGTIEISAVVGTSQIAGEGNLVSALGDVYIN